MSWPCLVWLSMEWVQKCVKISQQKKSCFILTPMCPTKQKSELKSTGESTSKTNVGFSLSVGLETLHNHGAKDSKMFCNFNYFFKRAVHPQSHQDKPFPITWKSFSYIRHDIFWAVWKSVSNQIYISVCHWQFLLNFYRAC